MAKLIDTGDMSPDLIARAQRMLDNCDIANVRLQAFSAERYDGTGAARRADVVTEMGYAVSKVAFANKIDWTVTLCDEQEKPVAEMSATFIVEYRLDESFEPDEAAADHICATTGHLVAYPYARELFESHAARLQLDPLVLGLLRLSDMNPRSLAAVARSSTTGETPAR